MKISELIEELAKRKEDVGDVGVKIEVGYFSGECGGHNSELRADIEGVTPSYRDESIIISGWED